MDLVGLFIMLLTFIKLMHEETMDEMVYMNESYIELWIRNQVKL